MWRAEKIGSKGERGSGKEKKQTDPFYYFFFGRVFEISVGVLSPERSRVQRGEQRERKKNGKQMASFLSEGVIDQTHMIDIRILFPLGTTEEEKEKIWKIYEDKVCNENSKIVLPVEGPQNQIVISWNRHTPWTFNVRSYYIDTLLNTHMLHAVTSGLIKTATALADKESTTGFRLRWEFWERYPQFAATFY